MYTEQERYDLFVIYLRNNRSIALTIREYQQVFPDRRIPNKSIFQRIEHDLQNHGVLKYKKRNKRRSILTDESQLNIALYFEEYPENSLIDAGRYFDTSRTTIHRALKINDYKIYKFSKLQELKPGDSDRRLQFCNELMDLQFATNYFRKICWTDEAIFTTAGGFNRRNSHHWGRSNPRKFKTVQHQGRQNVHVWCGIYNGNILGPIFLGRHLNGANYLYLLQTQIVPLIQAEGNAEQIVYQMDGAPCHNTGMVNNFLNENFAEWIGPNGTIAWPARSPDLSPLDYYLWGVLKDRVYRTRTNNAEELRNAISAEIERINNTNEVRKALGRLEIIYTTCIAENGGHVEHLI